jgi:hypothetical protein
MRIIVHDLLKVLIVQNKYVSLKAKIRLLKKKIFKRSWRRYKKFFLVRRYPLISIFKISFHKNQQPLRYVILLIGLLLQGHTHHSKVFNPTFFYLVFSTFFFIPIELICLI